MSRQMGVHEFSADAGMNVNSSGLTKSQKQVKSLNSLTIFLYFSNYEDLGI